MGAVHRLTFTDAELTEIDAFALEAGINLWKGPSSA